MFAGFANALNAAANNSPNMDSSDNSSNSNNQCAGNLNSSLANMMTNFCSSSCASPFNPMNGGAGAFSNGTNAFANNPLPANVDAARVREWLLANRFEKFFALFQMFNSNDLLNLSREDLIQICGLTDGIRLFNGLHTKAAHPKTTIYMAFETSLFRAVYLGSHKFDEFREKLLRMVCENNSNYDHSVLSAKLRNVLMIGPKKEIKVLVTEDVISNLEKESMYMLQIEQGKPDRFGCLDCSGAPANRLLITNALALSNSDANSDKYDLILKPFK